MKHYKTIILRTLAAFTLSIASNCYAAAIMPSDYLVAGDEGDTWTYEDINNNQFTFTLSQIDTGANAGRYHLGNDTNGFIYDVVDNAVTYYEVDNILLDPVAAFNETYETGQYYSIGTPGPNDYEFMFLALPNLTVQAGTFDDVLVQVWLDSSFGPNTMNSMLGLDSYGITAAVTDIDWWGYGQGLLAHLGVQADDGSIDGGYELIQTSIPEPSTILLLLSAFTFFLLKRTQTVKHTPVHPAFSITKAIPIKTTSVNAFI